MLWKKEQYTMNENSRWPLLAEIYGRYCELWETNELKETDDSDDGVDPLEPLRDEARAETSRRIESGQIITLEEAQEAWDIMWSMHIDRTPLFSRFMRQDLSDSVKAWGHYKLVYALSRRITQEASTALDILQAASDFETWLKGKSVKLRMDWPYDPVPDDFDGAVYNEDDIFLLFLSPVASAYYALGRQDEYFQKVEKSVSCADISDSKIHKLMAMLLSAVCAEFAMPPRILYYSGRYADMMGDLAEKTKDIREKFDHKEMSVSIWGLVAGHTKDEAQIDYVVARNVKYIAECEELGADWRNEKLYARNRCATFLVKVGRYEQAIPLWEANEKEAVKKKCISHFNYAIAIWQATKDRKKTIEKLHLAFSSAKNIREKRNLRCEFEKSPEFLDVYDDPEFLATLKD